MFKTLVKFFSCNNIVGPENIAEPIIRSINPLHSISYMRSPIIEGSSPQDPSSATVAPSLPVAPLPLAPHSPIAPPLIHIPPTSYVALTDHFQYSHPNTGVPHNTPEPPSPPIPHEKSEILGQDGNIEEF